MKDYSERAITGTPNAATRFVADENRFAITRLCGISVGGEVENSGPVNTLGVAVLNLDGQRYEGKKLVPTQIDRETPGVVTCRWRIGDTQLYLHTKWQGDERSGIISRIDALEHAGETPVTLSRCLARVALPPGRYEAYTQTSRWCSENQGAWQPVHTGLSLRHANGRTTEGCTPYLAVRSRESESGIAFHILPRGNWTIKIGLVNQGGEQPFTVIEAGVADENLNRTIAPGERFELPEILFQPLPQGEPHRAAPDLHRYLLERYFGNAKPEAPVIYNTWFEQFEILDLSRLREQLLAAKEIGCEAFVIDAGWYGAGGPNWSAQTGDWREKTDAAFGGNMKDFAEEVRAAGLGFGLWMEPERFGDAAPIRDLNPQWFVPVGSMARIDLTIPAAYTWLRNEIGRLVETYRLCWMKIDFNFSLDADASGAELTDYTEAWFRMLDEVREAYPDTFFEGCSSGAMRGDLAMLTHVDGHFLSDTVNPTDVMRISQGAWLRLPPGRLTRWVVVRSAGKVVPRYTRSVSDSPATVLTPCGAVWEPSESTSLDFALLAAMPGMPGFSGDIASLEPEHRALIAQAVCFYREWRRFITGSVAHLLTPPESIGCREGWIAVQLQAPDEETSLIFVYRIGAAGARPPLRPRSLSPERRYLVTKGFGASTETTELDGSSLMHEGLPTTRAARGGSSGGEAELYIVREKR